MIDQDRTADFPDVRQFVLGDTAFPPDPDRTGWNPILAEALYEFLSRSDLESPELGPELRRLEERYQDAVYSELIYLLSHLRFEAGEARSHWTRILEHREDTQTRLGSRVDLRVALVSYFVQVNRALRNPKIVEMKLFEKTRASAYRDELTGLHNYRFFGECLTQEVLRSERYGTPLSLVMIDVDDFKQHNDRHGHEAGNATLRTVARLLSSALRKIDIAARYGGEEFALILPSTSKVDAERIAERARETVEREGSSRERGSTPLTVSMGVTTYPADAKNAAELVRHADRALYFAKACGKNQVQLYGKSRRSFRRVRATLEGSCRTLGPERTRLTTINVSEGGLLFLSTGCLAVGTLVETTLELDGSRIVLCGRVVHTEREADGRFKSAVRIMDMDAADRVLLFSYLRNSAERSQRPEGADAR